MPHQAVEKCCTSSEDEGVESVIQTTQDSTSLLLRDGSPDNPHNLTLTGRKASLSVRLLRQRNNTRTILPICPSTQAIMQSISAITAVASCLLGPYPSSMRNGIRQVCREG